MDGALLAFTREVEEGALELGRRQGFDEAHARQVTRLALQLFDALGPLHALEAADRRILLAAGLLHDVGKAVAHRRHHRHSRYLIRHADPPGLTRHEVELVSLVARYHRASRPKRSHDRYGQLAGSDRKRVQKLAALLRVGDALDADHRQHVQTMSVDISDEEIVLHPKGAGGRRPEEQGHEREARDDAGAPRKVLGARGVAQNGWRGWG